MDYIAEIKFYKTLRAQIPYLKKAISMNRFKQETIQEYRNDGIGNVLIISSFLDSEIKRVLEEEEDVIIIDLSDLLSITTLQPDLNERLIKLAELPIGLIESINRNGRSFDDIFTYDYENKISYENIYEPEPENHSEILINRLKEVVPGRGEWKEYENVMVDILKFLFKDDLRGWHTQHGSDNKLNRYDCVCGINGISDFWVFLVNQIQSKYILFEFKNYVDEISQGEVLTTEKYLFDNAFRKVAIIFTRKGTKFSAEEMCRGAMRESGKLILILNDEDVINMLRFDNSGSDSSDYLLELTDQFLMKLSR